MTRRLLGVEVAGGRGTLVGDVHLPDGPGPAPAVLVRTPYGREGFAARGAWWAARGWVFVVQDVAGRHDSDGPWEPYAHEREDGGRTVDAIREAPWCDGRVVLAGASYSAFCAWQAALARPADVAAVVSEVPALGPPRTTRESGGVPRLGDHVAWWLRHGDARTSRMDAAISAALDVAGPDPLLRAPAAGLPERLGIHAPRFAATLRTPPGPGPLEPAALAQLPMPTLHVAGLFDLFLEDAEELWAAAGSARTPRPVGDLVLGPWGHALDGPDRHERTRAWLVAHVGGPSGESSPADDAASAGSLPTGRRATASRPEGPPSAGATTDAPPPAGTLPEGLLPVDGPAGPSVRRHRLPLGAGSWRSTAGPADTAPTVLTLAPDGRLVAERASAAASAPPRRASGWIVHDPTDPARSTVPGADRRVLGGPPDAHRRWRTDPLPDGGELDGRARLTAVALADPPHADWIGHLELHRPDGSVLSLARTTATVSSSPAAIDLRFPPVAALVPPGGALGLTLCGADHPDLLLHPRTPVDRIDAVERRPGRQRLAHDPDRPARLLLPLLPTPGPR